MSITLFISPVMRVSAQGRDRQVYTYVDERTKELRVGKPMNKTRAGAAGFRISFVPDYDNLRYKTGLELKVENPYFNTEPTHQIPESITKSKQITLQNLYEILDGVPLDTYHNRMTGGGIFRFTNKTDLSTQTSFIEQFEVTLYDRANRFDDSTPRGRMAIQLLKNHPYVALSKATINSTIHSFYISEENEALIERQKKQDRIEDAIVEKKLLLKQSNDFLAYKVASLCLYNDGKPTISGQANADLVKRQIDTYLSEGSHQMRNVDYFLDLMELLKKDKNRFDTKYLIQQAHNTGVLQVKDGYVIWPSKVNVKNLYKFSDATAFENLVLSEMLTHDSNSELSNVYGDLYEECAKKNARIE